MGVGRLKDRRLETSFVQGTDGECQISSNPTHGVFFSGVPLVTSKVSYALDNRQSILRQVVAEAGTRLGLPTRGYLTNVWQTNLNNSTDREELVEAVSRPQVLKGDAALGDWSAVILRWTQNGKPCTAVLNWSQAAATTPLQRCQVRAVADFDGDGKMEIVTTSESKTAWCATLWSFANGKPYPIADITRAQTP